MFFKITLLLFVVLIFQKLSMYMLQVSRRHEVKLEWHSHLGLILQISQGFISRTFVE